MDIVIDSERGVGQRDIYANDITADYITTLSSLTVSGTNILLAINNINGNISIVRGDINNINNDINNINDNMKNINTNLSKGRPGEGPGLRRLSPLVAAQTLQREQAH